MVVMAVIHQYQEQGFQLLQQEEEVETLMVVEVIQEILEVQVEVRLQDSLEVQEQQIKVLMVVQDIVGQTHQVVEEVVLVQLEEQDHNQVEEMEEMVYHLQ